MRPRGKIESGPRTAASSRGPDTECWRHRVQHKSTPDERFWAKVNKDGPVQPHTPELGVCWEWTGAKQYQGYGVISLKTGSKHKSWLAHRVAYILAFGPPPDSKPHVLHKCDNRACVRPDHLFAGTRRDNTIDMIRKGRARYRPLTDRSVAMVRAYLDGMTVGQIAARYRVNYGHAYAVVGSSRTVQLVAELTDS